MDFILSHKLQILSVIAVFEQVLPFISQIPGNSTLQVIVEIVKKVVSSAKQSE